MTFKDFQKFVKFAKKQGVLKLKVEGMEIEFIHDAVMPQPSSRIQAVSMEDAKSQYTDEQMLFWSTHDPLANTGT